MAPGAQVCWLEAREICWVGLFVVLVVKQFAVVLRRRVVRWLLRRAASCYCQLVCHFNKPAFVVLDLRVPVAVGTLVASSCSKFVQINPKVV